MFDFHEKRKIQRILYSKPVIAVLFLIGLVMSNAVYDRYVVSREMEQKLEERRMELEKLEMRAETLSAKVEYFADERGIEEELRSRFDVAKEGEQVIILLDSERSDHAGEAVGQEVESEEEETSFWDTIVFWR